MSAEDKQAQENGARRNSVTIDYLHYSFSGDHYCVDCYDKEASGTVTVLADIDGIPVTCVGWFREAPPERVLLPDSITRILPKAFQKCANLVEVRLPESLTEIGKEAFRDCGNLAKIHIPRNVERIPEGAFQDCKSLRMATLPEGLTEIGRSAFEGCGLLEEIRIPPGVRDTGYRSFMNCASLSKVSLPEGLEKIGVSSFSGCRSLREIRIPESVTRIWNSAFSDCGLCEIHIPSGVTEIGYSAFSDCEALRQIDIPEGVKEIDFGTFRGCHSLCRVGLPESLKTIEREAFDNCESLAEFRLPKGLRSCKCEFEGCEKPFLEQLLAVRKPGLNMPMLMARLFCEWETIASFDVRKCPEAMLRRVPGLVPKGNGTVAIAANVDRSLYIAELTETKIISRTEPAMVDVEKVYSPMEIKSMNGGYTGFDVPNPRAGQVHTEKSTYCRYFQVYEKDLQDLSLLPGSDPKQDPQRALDVGMKADPENRAKAPKVMNGISWEKDSGTRSAGGGTPANAPGSEPEGGTASRPSQAAPTSPPMKKGILQSILDALFPK